MDAGVLLSLPMESIAVRTVIASVVAALVARLLLRVGLRAPGVRAATAVVPAAALVVVTMLFWGSLRLPWVMLPVEAVNALPIPWRDTYVWVAPMAIPLLVAGWALIATTRIGLRVRAHLATRRRVAAALEHGASRSGRVRQAAETVAASMRMPVPPTMVVPECPGGASVVGIRRPVLVVDQRLVGRLDDRELEGVIAHELAHIRRCDNLIAFLLGIVRDLAFFVPGGRWALRQLHAERELAADQLAVETTGRPASLASGLLKVLDGAAVGTPCATLVPRGTLVGRVEQLIEPPPVTRLRSGVEMVAVASVLAVSVGAAVEVPAMMADDGNRDALAVLVQGSTRPAEAEPAAEARAFEVYRDAAPLETADEAAETDVVVTPVDDDPAEMSRSALYACAAGASCFTPEDVAQLSIEPVPLVRMPDTELIDRWRAKPVASMDEGTISVYWLQLRQ